MRRVCVFIVLVVTSGCVTIQHPSGMDEALRRGPTAFLEKAVVGPQDDGTYVVPTTQVVDPAGKTLLIPGRPVDLALSPDESLLAVKNRKDLVFVDMARNEVVQTLALPKEGNSFHGIAWSRDGQRIWTTDCEDALRVAARGPDGTFAWADVILLPGPGNKEGSASGGFIVDEDAGLIFVSMSRRNALGVVSLATKKLEDEIPVGIAPYTVVAGAVPALGKKAYVTNWGGRVPRKNDPTGPTSGSRAVVNPKTGIASTGTVSVIDLATRKVIKEIPVGLHPSGTAFAPDGSRLYVANANSDTISVIDTARDSVVQTLSAKPMDELPFGSAPNALAVSPDGGTLYVANGGNNALAVIDLKQGRVQGLIPVGWYPGAVTLTRDGKRLCVANTKGVGSRYQKPSAQPAAPSVPYGYSSHDVLGSLSFIPVPNAAELEDYTIRAATNMRLPLMNEVMNLKTVATRTVPVPCRPGEVSVFKHVLYIIKENRTYDQVFGDMAQGDGEPRYCQFGREVTPNHHALAEQFVLLDHFYCNGILSADGHQWTDEGYVTDYLEKSFGGFSRSYPYDGDDALAYASSGFIWDQVLCKGLTFRVYGEFVKAQIAPATATWSDIYADYLNGTKKVTIQAEALLDTLTPYLCPTFVGFPGKVQDVYRAREFINELHDFEANNNLPNFMIMLLPNDHTVGTREGCPTPQAAVADNDLALGQIVEAVSHSRFWPETAIFVVEDDPQGGLDHVDGHRTVAFCISPYTKRGVVDNTHYNQTGMLRTIELILGLPPMNQLLMASNPMYNAFQAKPDLTPYVALPNQIPLDQLNPKVTSLRGKQRYYALKSMEMPLDDIDQADEGTFNRILWHATKGYDVSYPDVQEKEEDSRERQSGKVAKRSSRGNELR